MDRPRAARLVLLVLLLVACARLAAGKGPGKLRPKDISHGTTTRAHKHGKHSMRAEHFSKAADVVLPQKHAGSTEQAKPGEEADAVEEAPTGSSHQQGGSGQKPEDTQRAPDEADEDEETTGAGDNNKQGSSKYGTHGKNIAALLNNLAQQRVQFAVSHKPVVQREQPGAAREAAVNTTDSATAAAAAKQAVTGTTQQQQQQQEEEQAGVQGSSVAWEPLSSNMVVGSAAGGHIGVAAAHLEELPKSDVPRSTVATASARPAAAAAGGVTFHRALPINALRPLDSSVSTAAVPKEAAQPQPATTASPPNGQEQRSAGLPAPVPPTKQGEQQQQQQQAVAAPAKPEVPAGAAAAANKGAVTAAPAPAPQGGNTSSTPVPATQPAALAPAATAPGPQISKAPAQAAPKQQQQPTPTDRPAVTGNKVEQPAPALAPATPAATAGAAQRHHHTVEVMLKPWGPGGQLPAASSLPANSQQHQLAALLVAAQLGIEQQLALLQPLLQSIGAAQQHEQLQIELLTQAAAAAEAAQRAAAASSPAAPAAAPAAAATAAAAAEAPRQLLVWPAEEVEVPDLSLASLADWREEDEDELLGAEAHAAAWGDVDVWPWLLAAAQAAQQ